MKARGFKKKRYKDFISPLEERREALGESMKELLDGKMLADNLIRKNVRLVLFLTVLGLSYITNGYHAEKLYMKKVALERTLSELRFESITTASELMKISTQSEVLRRVKEAGLGLEESTTAPIKIKI